MNEKKYMEIYLPFTLRFSLILSIKSAPATDSPSKPSISRIISPFKCRECNEGVHKLNNILHFQIFRVIFNLVNSELKTVLILLPVLVPFFPTHSTQARLLPPHMHAISLFNREKGARGGNEEKSLFGVVLVFSSFARVYACCFVCVFWSRCMV
jgi:hypothetical protein